MRACVCMDIMYTLIFFWRIRLFKPTKRLILYCNVYYIMMMVYIILLWFTRVGDNNKYHIVQIRANKCREKTVFFALPRKFKLFRLRDSFFFFSKRSIILHTMLYNNYWEKYACLRCITFSNDEKYVVVDTIQYWIHIMYTYEWIYERGVLFIDVVKCNSSVRVNVRFRRR